MPTVRRLLPLGAMLAALVIAGCGSSEGEIPRDDAQALLDTLDSLPEQADDPCGAADDTVTTLFGEIEALPDRVDDNIVAGLNELAVNLDDLLREQCQGDETTSTETTSTTEDTTSSSTTESSTTDTTDSSTTDTTDSSTTDQTTAPGNGPDGNGPPGQTDSGGGISPRQGGNG